MASPLHQPQLPYPASAQNGSDEGSPTNTASSSSSPTAAAAAAAAAAGSPSCPPPASAAAAAGSPTLSSPTANSGATSASSGAKTALEQQLEAATKGGAANVPPRVVLMHLLLFLSSGVIVALAFAHIGAWCAILAWFVLAKMGALRLPWTLLSLMGVTGSGDAMSEALRRCDTMPQPITKKDSYSGKGSGVAFACSSMQGWRRGMEDSHSTVTDLRSVIRDGNLRAEPCSLFAVFDGHSGSTIAQFCGNMLPQFITESAFYKERRYADAMRDSYISIDKHLSQHPTYRDDRSGCTAVSILLSPTEIFCANAGDSRAVLCRSGRALPLSIDHKPTLPVERKRIERAKSFVHNKRVNGVLALSRAIGDFSFKRRPFIPWEQQAVTCVPDVTTSVLQRDADEFVVVACDGIWDVLTSEAVIAFVRTRLLRGVSAQAVAEQLMEKCLSTSPFGLGCDNMSVVIVLLKGTHELGRIVDKVLLEGGEGDAVAAAGAASAGAHHGSSTAASSSPGAKGSDSGN